MFLLLTTMPLSRAYMHKTIKKQYQIIRLSTSHSSLWSCVLCVAWGRFIRGMKCAEEYYLKMIFLRTKGESSWTWRGHKILIPPYSYFIPPSPVIDLHSFSSNVPALLFHLDPSLALLPWAMGKIHNTHRTGGHVPYLNISFLSQALFKSWDRQFKVMFTIKGLEQIGSLVQWLPKF